MSQHDRRSVLGSVTMVLALLVVGTACSRGDPPVDPCDGATPPADAGSDLDRDAPAETVCMDGSAPDALGRCARWTSLASGAPQCVDVVMTALSRGDVLVLGNCHEPADPMRLVSGFIFDEETRAFRALAGAPAPTTRRTITRLSDGRVLSLGGVIDTTASPPIADASLYDEGSARFTAARPMITPRWFHTATLLDDGRVLVAGGTSQLVVGVGEPTALVEIYDPATNAWQAAAPMRVARRMHTANLLDNGRVIVVGGIDASGATTAVEIYDPFRDAWHDGPSIETAPVNHTASTLSDGSLVVLSRDTALRSFSDATGFLPIAPIHGPREGHIAIDIDDGLLLVVGGVTLGGNDRPPAEIYDPTPGTWTDTSSPDTRIWSDGPSNAAHLPHGVLVHSDNVGFFVYEWPAPHF